MPSTRRSPSQEERVTNSVSQQKRVVIENHHCEKLAGILHETGSKEIVVVCHGFRSLKERIPMVNLAAVLEKAGISAFRFDFAGNGESEGSFQFGNYRGEIDDLRAVVEHFSKEKRVITAIVGHSKGGNVVLLYASKYNDVPTVINISGRFHIERGIEGRLGKNFLQRITQHGFIYVVNKEGKFRYRVTQKSLMDRLSTDTRAGYLSIHEDCRVLTVHGSADKIVPPSEAFEFDKLILNHTLHILKDADHDYTSHQNELSAMVLNFIKADCRHMPKDIQSSARAHSPIRSRV